MDLATFQPFLNWITAHPTWAGLAVFLISLSESLVIVGLFVPGVAMMFGIGALVAMGALNLWVTLACAVAGAVAGDGISFWLGHHYKDHIRDMWPFRRYPALMARGERFFEKHGGKSVLFGRFVGPVRPIIPTVAGMLGMPPARFLTVNILSALAWAPAYTLPGVLFGASMGVASEIGSRLTVLTLGVLVILWLTGWLVYRAYLYLQPRGTQILERLLNWGASHRYAGKVVTSVLDPEQSAARGLAILGTVLICIALLLVTVGHSLFGNQLTLSNHAVFNLLQGLRVPWADRLMVFLSELGSITVLLSITVAVIAWLAWQRIWLAVIHCIASAVFALFLTIALDWSRTAPLSDMGINSASGRVVVSTVLFGLLAVIVTQGLRGIRRWIPYAVAGVLMVAIILSELYLGAVWLSQALAGTILALLWVAILGAAYRLHATVPVAPHRLTAVVFFTLFFAVTIQNNLRYDHDLARYAPQRSITPITQSAWWNAEWRSLPAYRIDMEGRGKQPLTVQWSGDLSALAAQLKANAWQSPLPLNGRNILQWLRPSPPLKDLPLLPQAHDGRYDALRLIHTTANPQQLVVLRLWSSNHVLREPDAKLWVGTVTMVHATTPMPWLTVPITGTNFDTPLKTLQTALGGLEWKAVQHPQELDMPWNGTVLLIHPKTAEKP